MNDSVDAGMQARDEAIQNADYMQTGWVQEARALAIRIAITRGKVSINELRDEITLPPGMHPNAWGAVFHTRELIPFGYTKARHRAAHARTVRTYVHAAP